ncbi:endonuclease/exonuclease/phosphatase family protein [Roseateles sp. L2-2]|uniref:endonuclease/exonuclease/phosphatase family protein n=1 Tax=Roseateles sp. L2-2 TaxID=3422597 RepID=UPI003D35A08A
MKTDEPTEQHHPDRDLRIAWWNTGLSPPRAPDRASSDDFKLASKMLCHLLEENRADVIVLGEMAESSVKGLREACPIARSEFTWLPAFHKAGLGRFSFCVLSRTNRVTVDFSSPIVRNDGERTCKVGLHFLIRPHEGGAPFSLIASHWPSRLHLDRSDSARTHIAAHLRRWIDDQLCSLRWENLILIGDFNDEPFDEGLERYLYASRDRNKVLRNPNFLYNPFWRHLSSLPLRSTKDQDCDAGTYHHPAGQYSDWHTFDQLIVSSALLLGRSGWRLNEENTRVSTLPALDNDETFPQGIFDHLPIIGHLERTSS